MTRTLRRLFVTAAVVLAISNGLAGTAWAAFNPVPEMSIAPGAPVGKSSTNPNSDTEIDSWWRQGWGNSLNPQFELDPPSTEASTTGFVIGTLYSITTDPADIDLATPDIYYRAARGSGTHLSGTVDLVGIYNYPPPGGWRSALYPGATSLLEGPWSLNFVWFSSKGNASDRTMHLPMHLDLTPPSAVESLTLSPTTNPGDATSVTATSRVHISWKPKQYDALSGVGYFQILLDDSTVIPASDSADDQGRVYDIPGASPSDVTIEDLPAGRHKISVEAVDRATNVGPPSCAYFYSDPDVPTVSITSPSGSLIGVKPTIAAAAADKGGVKSVIFKLDGVVILTKTSAPYSANVDLSSFAAGNHALTATVTDMYGRQVTASKTVTLDKTALKITSFSRNYSLFYPIKRDKYKDNLTITFYANKACSAKVLVTTSAGKLVRTLTKSAAAGKKNTVTWDGKWSSDNKAHTGTFYVQVTATDSAGNSAATSKLKTVIRNYEIIKLSRNRAKVVAR